MLKEDNTIKYTCTTISKLNINKRLKHIQYKLNNTKRM